MTITAKFPGTCKICLRPIRIGEKIEWQKGAGATHLKCVGKTPVTLNSPPPPSLITPSTDLAALAQRYGHTLRGEPRTYVYTCRVRKGQSLKKVGDTFTWPKAGKMLVIATTRPTFYSADDMEDMDIFDHQGSGLYYDITTLAIEPTAEEKAEAERTKAQQVEQEQRKKAEHERINKRLAELTTPPEGWTAIDGAELVAEITIADEHFVERPLPVPPESEWKKLDEEHDTSALQRYAVLYQAGPYRVCKHGNWDDWRQMVMIPPDLVDSYISAVVKCRGITLAEAREWLEKYRGCVGTEIYEWAETHLTV